MPSFDVRPWATDLRFLRFQIYPSKRAPLAGYIAFIYRMRWRPDRLGDQYVNLSTPTFEPEFSYPQNPGYAYSNGKR